MYEGFEWAYYFKNYSIDSDVKRPIQFPKKTILVILRWLSQETPKFLERRRILIEVIRRGKLDSEAIHKAIDVIISDPSEQHHHFMLLSLMKNSQFNRDHVEKIRNILASYPEELRNQILRALENPEEREFQMRRVCLKTREN